MKYRNPQTGPNRLPRDEGKRLVEDFVWSTSEQTRLRTLSLYIIRSIVEKYGGTINIDLRTDTINVDVPEKNRVACAREIDEKVGDMSL